METGIGGQRERVLAKTEEALVRNIVRARQLHEWSLHGIC
jgi:hypothetical protein